MPSWLSFADKFDVPRSRRVQWPGAAAAAFVLALMLGALAGWRGRRDRIHPAPAVLDGWLGLLPCALVGLAAVGVTVDVALRAAPSRAELVLLGTLVLALLVRQALTMLDNVRLAAVLEQRERHVRSLLHGGKDVMILCGQDLRAMYVSPSSVEVLGLVPDEILGRALWELVHPEDVVAVRYVLSAVLDGWSGTSRLRCRIASGGAWIDTESTVGDLRNDPSVGGLVITTRDVSKRTALEDQLRRLARQDPLTGLANRTVLRERLDHALSLRWAAGSLPGLLLIDLDGFKTVNDTAGHQAGDALLVEVAARLVAAVRQGDTVARLGGDEFAILLEDRGDGDPTGAGETVARRLLESLARPVFAAGRELAVSASLGLVVARPESSSQGLLREADIALYASKSGGRGRLTVFDDELKARAARRTQLTGDLRTAVDNGELVLAFQPVVDLARGAVVGVEALARWNHPDWGYVSPGEFIPMAEESGVIESLGSWALTTAIRQAEIWHADGWTLDIAVNVSARQLGPEFVAQVAEGLAGSTLPAQALTLEITESVLVDDEDMLRSLAALRALGVRLAIDDFGTGWSSLGYLRKLPVDVLKLDRSFVADLGSKDADALCRAVLTLAKELGLDVVAEGVETEAQRQILTRMGCGYAQGWLFGRAVPADRLQQESARLGASSRRLPTPRSPESREVVPACEIGVSQS